MKTTRNVSRNKAISKASKIREELSKISDDKREAYLEHALSIVNKQGVNARR